MQTPGPPNPLIQGPPGGAAPYPAAPATAAKEAVLAAVERHFDESVDFLRDLVRCPSTRGNTNGAQRLVAGALRRMGLDVQEVGIDRRRIAALPGFSPAEWSYDGLIQVVGRLPGAAPAGGRSLVLNGHLDVVSPEPVAHWRHDPWGGEVADGRLYGRGACDMKSGVAAMLFALRSVRAAGVALQGDVLVQTVIDEECGGNGTLALLDQGYRGDAVVVPEPSGLGLSSATLGVVWGRIRVRGHAAHAGSASTAVNAIEKAYVVVRALRGLEAEVNRPEVRHPLYAAISHPLNFNLGTIQGGDWPSSVPEACTLEVRLSCFPGEDPSRLEARARDHLARAAAEDPWLRETPPEVTFFGFRGEGAVYDTQSEIARTVAGNHALVAGAPPPVGVSTATDDRRFFQLYYDTPAVCYGPAGGQLHAVDEWVDLASVRTCTRVLAGTLLDWCGTND
jgi:acetylornithine deacetylase